MYFHELKEFGKDKKKLVKKYRSIPDDLEVVKQVLEVMPDERPPFSYRINNLGIKTCVIKVKKIACKALKGKGVNSGLRLVYAHYKIHSADTENSDYEQTEEEFTNKEKVVFIELYHKSDKENEDRERILKYFK
jgi:hypothetical protein